MTTKTSTKLGTIDEQNEIYEAFKAAANQARAIMDSKPKINSPEDIVKFVAPSMALADREEFHVISLDTKNRVIADDVLYKGTINQAPIRVAEVFRTAILNNATSIVIAHNHPSGDPTPSAADVSVTEDIVKAGKLLDIEVLDHMVIGMGAEVSLRRLGLGFSSH